MGHGECASVVFKSLEMDPLGLAVNHFRDLTSEVISEIPISRSGYWPDASTALIRWECRVARKCRLPQGSRWDAGRLEVVDLNLPEKAVMDESSMAKHENPLSKLCGLLVGMCNKD